MIDRKYLNKLLTVIWPSLTTAEKLTRREARPILAIGISSKTPLRNNSDILVKLSDGMCRIEGIGSDNAAGPAGPTRVSSLACGFATLYLL